MAMSQIMVNHRTSLTYDCGHMGIEELQLELGVEVVWAPGTQDCACTSSMGKVGNACRGCIENLSISFSASVEMK